MKHSFHKKIYFVFNLEFYFKQIFWNNFRLENILKKMVRNIQLLAIYACLLVTSFTIIQESDGYYTIESLIIY